MRTIVPAAVVAAGLGLAGTAMTGCSSDSGASSRAGKQAPEATLAAANEMGPLASSDKSGNQLWAETCARCHNMRDPGSYSDVNWNITVHHMRLRADMNAEESRKILEFLKSAN